MANHIVEVLKTSTAPIVWGSTYIVTTEFLPAGMPLTISMLRALPAGLLLLLFGRALPERSWWTKIFVLGVLNIGAFFYFLFIAAYRLPGGIAALVLASQPLFILVLSAVILKTQVRFRQVLACVIGAIGVALVVLTPAASLDFVGVAAGLAGAMSMALGTVLAKRWGRPPTVGVLDFTGWQLLAGGIVLLPLAIANEGMPSGLSATNAAGFAFLVIVGTIYTYVLWFRGIAKLQANAISFLLLLSPLSAMILGFAFLNQDLKPTQLVGALAVLAGIVLAQRSRH